MKNIELADLKNIADYEKLRADYRKKLIDEKKHRRIHVGPLITFVFENRTTVIFQIQEMMRTERLVHDTQIQHEIDTYKRLLPDHNELSATMLIEITEKSLIRSTLDSLVGLPKNSLFFVIGEKEIEATFDEEQSSDDRISAVQYVRWQFEEEDVERMRFGQADVSVMIRHANYHHFTRLTDEQREALVKDISE